jgi:hypothetical protein
MKKIDEFTGACILYDSIDLEVETICYDINHLCNLLVNILNDNEQSNFRFIEINKFFIQVSRYIRYYIVTDSKEEIKLDHIVSYDQFKDMLEKLKKNENTFFVHYYEGNFSFLSPVDNIDSYIISFEIIKEELTKIENKNKHFRILGTSWRYNEDCLDGIFNKYRYLKEIFDIFHEYRRQFITDFRKTVDYANATNEKKYIIESNNDGRWRVKDIEAFQDSFKNIVNSQYQLFNVYNEYKEKNPILVK